MPLVELPGMRSVNMGELQADLEWAGDVAYVRPRRELDPYPRSLVDTLDDWAARTPDQTLFADRGPDGGWRKVSYAEAARHSRAIAQYLIDLGLSAERPVVVLSGNGIEHALLALGTHSLNSQAVDDTLGVILKYQEDVDRVRGDIADTLVERAERGIPA